jgi:hypothetical protein
VDAGGGVQADADRDQQIENDEPDQHDRMPAGGWSWGIISKRLKKSAGFRVCEQGLDSYRRVLPEYPEDKLRHHATGHYVAL